MIRKPRLLTPGPTPVHPDAIAAMARSMPHHRSAEFEALLVETRALLQRFYRTANEVVIVNSSGSGAMEAVLDSMLMPGEKAIIVNAGKFGARWVEIGKRRGIDVVEYTLEWGQSPDPKEIANLLSQHKDARALCLQAVETSTASIANVHEIGKLLRKSPDCLYLIDGVTWIGSHDVDPDAAGADAVICASQKSFAIPPGLATVSLSEQALARMAEANQQTSLYLDLEREYRAQIDGRASFTPPLTLIAALHASLNWIESLPRGVSSLIANSQMLAKAMRAALTAHNLKIFPKQPADSLTAFHPPEGLSSSLIMARLQDGYGISVADGQDQFKGRMLRVGHMGYVDAVDTLGFIGALESVLDELGVTIELGAGGAAAQGVIHQFEDALLHRKGDS